MQPLKFSTTQQASMDGIKVLVYGRSGMGKTVLCATAPSPIILSAERGLLSLRHTNIPVLQIDNLEDFRQAKRWVFESAEARQFGTICLDSISEIAEQCLNNAKRTHKDPRQAYGVLIEEMETHIRDFRDLVGPNVYFSAKMEPLKDELTGIVKYTVAMPGSKLGPKMPYFFDEVFRLDVNKDAQGKEYRFLQTFPDMQYEAKDRSGALAPIEPPDLGHIFNKIRQGAV